MTERQLIVSGATVTVKAQGATQLPVTVATETVGVVAVRGPAGADGAPGVAGVPGPAFNGTAWWEGTGPPETIVGSKGGDYYIDVSTGVIYELQ